MNPRVVNAIPLDNYRLKLLFANGEQRIYDCTGLLNFGVFQELQDQNYFKRVNLDHGTVVWPNEQDICPDTLYLDAEKV